MADREMVIEGLEHCMNGLGCFECPYSVADKSSPDCQLKNGRDALELLKQQPEIVRCKNCTYGVKSPTFQHYPNLTWCNKHSTTHNDEWFCADGERR